MPLSIKGKHMLNTLILEYGKKKGRRIFYAMEHKRPDLTTKWRNKDGKTKFYDLKGKRSFF